MELIHGGDVEGYRLETGKNALDFSANCNPLGVPEGVRLAIAQAAHEADLYPDPLCRRLRRAISGKESVPEDYIFCGNGSAELLYRLALAIKPKKALITAPTFSEYELALRTVDCRIDYFTLNKQTAFALTGSILDSLSALPDIVILCNPNNPTGRTIERTLLLEIIEKCKKLGIRLVIDECFVGFLDDPAAHTLKDLLPQNPHVLILQAFTKLYGMAGVRLGYCMCSDTALLELLFKAGQPWSVSHLAQRAGIAALREREYVARSRQLVQAERPMLSSELEKLGFEVIASEANYILFSCSLPGLAARMAKRGVLIRDCGNYRGLREGYYRVAVRGHESNLELISTLRVCRDEIIDSI